MERQEDRIALFRPCRAVVLEVQMRNRLEIAPELPRRPRIHPTGKRGVPLVPRARVELARLAAADFESAASTDSAIGAGGSW